MKKIIAILLSFLALGCKSDLKPKKIDLANLNIIVKYDKKIDSVWVSDFGQTESYFLPFKDTIKVNFNTKINDLYRIDFYTKNGRIDNQFWLNGTNIILSGNLNKKIEIDTVLNSDLYYKSISFYKNYFDLIQSKKDSATIDEFLLNKVTENINNPFSFAVADPYIERNQNNKNKIRKLFNLLAVQNDTLKNHIISNHRKIENILTVSSIDISNYKFDNIDNKLSSIEFEKSKTYLMDFWFINCAPCVKDHKLISNKLDLLKEKNVELIGISTDRNHADWKEYLTKHNYSWKNYREVESLKRVTQDMAIWYFPTYLLINNNGEIKGRYNSFEDFEKTLE